MPIPIDPKTIDNERQLRELLVTKGFTEGYYADVRARLQEVEKMHDAIRHLEAERAAARKVKVVQSKPKKRGQLDARSVEHTVKNGLAAGGVAGPLLVGREVLGIYDELKGRGIAPTEETVLGVIRNQGFSDATIVYFWTCVIIVVVGTILYKLTKEYA